MQISIVDVTRYPSDRIAHAIMYAKVYNAVSFKYRAKLQVFWWIFCVYLCAFVVISFCDVCVALASFRRPVVWLWVHPVYSVLPMYGTVF